MSNPTDPSADQPRRNGAYDFRPRRDGDALTPEAGHEFPVVEELLEAVRSVDSNHEWLNRPDVLASVALAALFEPGDEELGLLVDAFGPELSYHALVGTDADNIVWQDITSIRSRIRSNVGAAKIAIKNAVRQGQRVFTPRDGQYPEALLDLGDVKPLALFVRGNIDVLADTDQVLNFAGPRVETTYGLNICTDWAASAAEQGKTILGNGGYGVGGSAIRVGLHANGNVAAVMAGGLDNLYPNGHRTLLETVEQRGGALISEYPPGTVPTQTRMERRGTILAALSRTTVVVEAGARSGALATAHAAKALGRDVFAVPGPVNSIASVGANNLIKDGTARMATSFADLNEERRLAEDFDGDA